MIGSVTPTRIPFKSTLRAPSLRTLYLVVTHLVLRGQLFTTVAARPISTRTLGCLYLFPGMLVAMVIVHLLFGVEAERADDALMWPFLISETFLLFLFFILL